jgi:hypothetical protein
MPVANWSVLALPPAKKPSQREADLRHRRAKHTLRWCRKVALLKQLKSGRRRELWVLGFKQCYKEEKWSRDFELERRTYEADGVRYKSRLVLSKLEENKRSPGARKDWYCHDPFDKCKTSLHRLAARARHALRFDRAVLEKGGFDRYWGDHNRGEYGHYKLLWGRVRAQLQPEENRAVFKKKPAAASA